MESALETNLVGGKGITGQVEILRLAVASKVVDVKSGKSVDINYQTSDSCTSCYTCQCDGGDSCDCVCQSNCCDCDASAKYELSLG